MLAGIHVQTKLAVYASSQKITQKSPALQPKPFTVIIYAHVNWGKVLNSHRNPKLNSICQHKWNSSCCPFLELLFLYPKKKMDSAVIVKYLFFLLPFRNITFSRKKLIWICKNPIWFQWMMFVNLWIISALLSSVQ